MTKSEDFQSAVLTTVKQLATSPSLKAAALPIIDQIAGLGLQALIGKIKIPDAKARIAELVTGLAKNDARAQKAILAKRARKK